MTSRAILASGIIVTMLPSSPQVKMVYLEGLLPVLRSLPQEEARTTLCIDSTTLDVSVAKDVAVDVISTGAEMVDAPVSGGVCLYLAIVISDNFERWLCCRRDWCKSWYSFVSCWGHRIVF